MVKRRAKRPSPAKKPKKVAKSRPAAKKSSAKKSPAKKAVAKKPAARQAPAKKKASAKKAPVAKPSVARKAPVAKPVVAKSPSVARLARSALAQKRAIQSTLGQSPLGKDVVDAYMRDVDHPFKAEMEAVRQIILGASAKLAERIKWNAPSFYYKEDFAAFNPRASEFVHLIVLFPGGQGMDDHGNLLEGKHKDRREAKFHSMDDVNAKKPALERLVRRWLELRGA